MDTQLPCDYMNMPQLLHRYHNVSCGNYSKMWQFSSRLPCINCFELKQYKIVK